MPGSASPRSDCRPRTEVGGTDDLVDVICDKPDFGKLDQELLVRTQYGTKAELDAVCAAVREAELRGHADSGSRLRNGSRCQNASSPGHTTRRIARARSVDRPPCAPGRISPFQGAGAYSGMEWHWQHFTAVNRDDGSERGSSFWMASCSPGMSMTSRTTAILPCAVTSIRRISRCVRISSTGASGTCTSQVHSASLSMPSG